MAVMTDTSLSSKLGFEVENGRDCFCDFQTEQRYKMTTIHSWSQIQSQLRNPNNPVVFMGKLPKIIVKEVNAHFFLLQQGSLII